MAREVSGKTALILLVEEQLGFQNFSDSYRKYLRNQYKKLYHFLYENCPDSIDGILDAIIQDTKRELEYDWQDAFIMDPQRQDSHTEIDIFSKEGTNPKIVLQQEFKEELLEREKLCKIADSVAESNKNWDRWKRALSHLEHIEAKTELLETINHNQQGLNSKEKVLVKGLAEEINKLRFGINVRGRAYATPHPEKSGCWKVHITEHKRSLHGDGIYISYTRWANLRNRLNQLIGNNRRYKVKEYEKGQESEDLLDHADYIDPDFLSCI